MTFVLNLLHRDFSLLIADIQANAEGPTTIKIGNITINALKGAKINGYSKIFLDATRSIAVGIAGEVKSHNYKDTIGSAAGIEASLTEIRSSIQAFVQEVDRKELIITSSCMENQAIATFFDPEVDSFFTNLFLFSKVASYSRWFWPPDVGSRLLHIGTGSARFEEAVGKLEIERFCASVTSVSFLSQSVEWIARAYEKVAAIEMSVSKESRGFIATETPAFCEIKIS